MAEDLASWGAGWCPLGRGSCSVGQALREGGLGLLRLLQPVQDELAGIDEALHAVHEARLGPAVQLRTRLVHALLPAELGHLVHQLLEALLLRLHLDEALELGVGAAQAGGGRRVHPATATTGTTGITGTAAPRP